MHAAPRTRAHDHWHAAMHRIQHTGITHHGTTAMRMPRLVTTRSRDFSGSLSLSELRRQRVTYPAREAPLRKVGRPHRFGSQLDLDRSSVSTLAPRRPAGAAADAAAEPEAESGGGVPAGGVEGSAVEPVSTIELANAVLYLGCTVIFIPASLAFLPSYKEEWEELAVWCFIAGSLGFQWVACWDLFETIRLDAKTGEEAAQIVNCCMFAVGSLLFVVGSVLFLPGYNDVRVYEVRHPPAPPPATGHDLRLLRVRFRERVAW